jgi:hypothetical protein
MCHLLNYNYKRKAHCNIVFTGGHYSLVYTFYPVAKSCIRAPTFKTLYPEGYSRKSAQRKTKERRAMNWLFSFWCSEITANGVAWYISVSGNCCLCIYLSICIYISLSVRLPFYPSVHRISIYLSLLFLIWVTCYNRRIVGSVFFYAVRVISEDFLWVFEFHHCCYATTQYRRSRDKEELLEPSFSMRPMSYQTKVGD